VYTDRDTSGWISGVAFGKNLWNHAKNSAVAYYWAINGGSGVTWESESWNNDVLGKITKGIVSELKVPVVYSGKDKLLYLIEHNANWIGTMHTNIYANDVIIDKFRSSYDNPFARHHNSKAFSRYVATKIPNELIKKEDKFVTIKIDMTLQNTDFHFREIGTHDYFD